MDADDKLKRHVIALRKYYNANAEILNAKAREYRKIHSERLLATRRHNRLANRDHVNEAGREYDRRRGPYRIRNIEKVTCPCGSTVLKYSMSRHVLSNKHLRFIE